MVTIFHNPRCSKSRECNLHLSTLGKEIEVINYLKTPFTEQTLRALLKKLSIKPIELVRTNEAIWKEQFKGLDMSDLDIIKAMVKYPKLIQRPIVVNNDKAVIARPLDRVNSIFTSD